MARYLFALLLWLSLSACGDDAKVAAYDWIPLKVTATAYTDDPEQTSRLHPGITAWGDSLRPGVKWIAVSRDLIAKGLGHNTMVKIDTFEGIYLVKDKMHRRWRNRIDIFMGKDVERAREWGRRKVSIAYAVKKDSLNTDLK
ncbi:3D domain-containing protein [Maribacter sp. 2307ULW6-5]|uniref:3D domain-containing protein n=1 Tax=Maribacter sp. 2307ULW6-5 TaxID=3386275 RepID=UPI0039BC4621